MTPDQSKHRAVHFFKGFWLRMLAPGRQMVSGYALLLMPLSHRTHGPCWWLLGYTAPSVTGRRPTSWTERCATVVFLLLTSSLTNRSACSASDLFKQTNIQTEGRSQPHSNSHLRQDSPKRRALLYLYDFKDHGV